MAESWADLGAPVKTKGQPESWADLGKPAPVAQPKMRPESERPVMRSRQPEVGESGRFGEAVAARQHEAMQTLRAGAKEREQHPVASMFDIGSAAKQVGAYGDWLGAIPGAALDVAARAAHGGREADIEEGAAGDPKKTRGLGDLAVGLLPGPKIGEAVRGAEEIGGAARTALRETGAARTAADRAKAGVEATAKAATEREKNLHALRVKELEKYGVDELMPGQKAGGAARAKEAAKIEDGWSQAAYIARAKKANDSFQRGTYNQVLDELSGGGIRLRYPKGGPVGNQGVAWVQKIIGQAYDRVLPQIKLKVDKQLTDELKVLDERAEGLRNPETATVHRSLDRTVRQQLGTPGAELNGEKFKTMESELTRDIHALRQNPLHWREKELLQDYLDAVRAAAERASPPTASARLKQVNNAFAKLAKVEDAAATHADAGGHFTPRELLGATKRGDASPRHRRFAAGEAHMQGWADSAHQVMRRDTEGHTALHMAHVPTSTTGGIVAGVRAAGAPVASHLAERKFAREAVRAAQQEARSRLKSRTPLSGSTKRRVLSAAEAAGLEGAIQSDDQQ